MEYNFFTNQRKGYTSYEETYIAVFVSASVRIRADDVVSANTKFGQSLVCFYC